MSRTMNNMDTSHLLTGFIKAKVIAINPSKEEAEDILKEELTEEPVYVWEDKYGVKNAKVSIYLEDVKKQMHSISFYLSNQDETSKTGKIKYINCVGETQWVEDSSQLRDGFLYFQETKWEGGRPIETKNLSKKEYRICKRGEEQLLHYRKMLLEKSVKDEEANLFYDLDLVFQEGDFSEFRDEIGTDSYHFVIFLYVTEDLQQRVWKEFLPLNLYREINNNMSFSQYTRWTYERWKKNIEGDYGIKGYYELTSLKKLNSEILKSDFEITESDDKYLS
jgi:hypothetical protein